MTVGCESLPSVATVAFILFSDSVWGASAGRELLTLSLSALKLATLVLDDVPTGLLPDLFIATPP